jgi:hypothetical protein
MRRRNIIASMKLDHEHERLELDVRKNNERERAASIMQLSGKGGGGWPGVHRAGARGSTLYCVLLLYQRSGEQRG